MVCPRLISNKFHKSMHTAVPMVKKVNKPTILHPKVHARKTPVRMSHVHHSLEYSLWDHEFRIHTGNIRRNSRVSKFAEADVRVQGQGHEKAELRVEKDQAGLCDVAVVCMRNAISRQFSI